MLSANSMVLLDGSSRLEVSRFCLFAAMQTIGFKAIDLLERAALLMMMVYSHLELVHHQYQTP